MVQIGGDLNAKEEKTDSSPKAQLDRIFVHSALVNRFPDFLCKVTFYDRSVCFLKFDS